MYESDKTNDGRNIYYLSCTEFKRALCAYLLPALPKKPPRNAVIQVDVTYCKDADRIIGAEVWFTLEPEKGQDPAFVVRVPEDTYRPRRRHGGVK